MKIDGKEVKTGKNMLETAINFLKNDKLSVIPVGKDKKPLISWKDFQKKRATQKQLKEWWTQFPEAQLGIVTGEVSNLTVVDIEAGGDYSYLPQDTFIVKTGGGGRHYYFQYCEGIKNKARIRELTDFRSEGGFVVAPPSISDKGEYEVIKAGKPAPFPIELFKDAIEPEVKISYKERVKAKKENIVKPPEPIKEYIAANDINIFEQGKQIEETPENILDIYPGFSSGQRNEEMTKYTGYVLKRIPEDSWDTTAWDIVSLANDKNTPPLGERELLSLFTSIKNREKVQKMLQNPEVVAKMLSEEGDEVKHIKDVADEQKIDQEDVYSLEMPCFDDVTLGGICPGDLVIIAGKTGEGKSSLAMDWTLSLLRGKKKAPVLWFSYELLPTHLWKKFEKMGMTKNDVAVIPAKHSTGNVAWVESKIKEAKKKFGVKAVVIDHLGFLLPKSSSIFGGKSMSSNYATFLTQIVREIKTIAIQEEVMMIMPVHARKTSKLEMDDIKDSVGISQESDLVFLIERERATKKSANTYYTDFTKITLSKNRKTGITISAWFKMFNERFVFDTDKNTGEKQKEKEKEDVDEFFDKINEKEIGPVASSPCNKFGYPPRAYEDATDKKVDQFAGAGEMVTVKEEIKVEKTAEDLALESVFK